MYNPRVGGKQDTFFPFTFVGAAAPTLLLLLTLCQRMAPMGSDSPIAGRVGKKHVSFRNLAGAPPPNPGSLFVRTKSDQKTAREEKPFRWGFSPVTPSSATTQRGARVGTSYASLILTQASGFARCAAPPSSSANAPLVCLGAAPPGPFSSHIGLSAMLGGFQRGRAPFVSSRGWGS